MKLTCVTATFNCIKAGNRESLIRAVMSVAKLKTEHEHLIYDAKSSDGTTDLLLELSTKISQLKIVSEKDTGIYNAINKGVRDARGEWFYVLGADDYIINPEVLDRLLSEDDCDQFVTRCVTNDSLREITLDRIFFASPYCHQGTVVKTSVLRAFGGFDEQFKICADYDFFLKLHEAAKRIRYLNEIFAYYDDRGWSSREYQATIADDSRVASRHFHRTFDEYMDFRLHGRRPSIRVALKYVLHPDSALRSSARRDVLRSFLWPILVFRRLVLRTKKKSLFPTCL